MVPPFGDARSRLVRFCFFLQFFLQALPCLSFPLLCQLMVWNFRILHFVLTVSARYTYCFLEILVAFWCTDQEYLSLYITCHFAKRGKLHTVFFRFCKDFMCQGVLVLKRSKSQSFYFLFFFFYFTKRMHGASVTNNTGSPLLSGLH